MCLSVGGPSDTGLPSEWARVGGCRGKERDISVGDRARARKLDRSCEKTTEVVGYNFFCFLGWGEKQEQLDQESQRHDLNYGRGRLGTPNCPVNEPMLLTR